MSLNDLVVDEVLKRRSTLLDGNSVRSAAANTARKSAWCAIQQAVVMKTGKAKTIEQLKVIWSHRKARIKEDLSLEKRYVTATGGGIDAAIESTIANNRDKWTDADNELVRALGPTPAFRGISNRFETSAVSVNHVRKTTVEDETLAYDDDEGSPSPKRKKLTFESEADSSDDNELLNVRPKSFSNRQFMQEQQKLITQQRLFFEKQNVLTSTLLRLAEEQLTFFRGLRFVEGEPTAPNCQNDTLPGDSNIDASVLSLS